MSRIALLKPLFTTENINPSDRKEQNIGLAEQKSHEIYSLAPIIDCVCHKYNIDFIIDVGSGLVSGIVLHFRLSFELFI